MKQFNYLLLFCLLLLTSRINAQDSDMDSDSTGLPGDNFSLQGALEMFKNAKSLEEFEKQLNTENNAVNNLDLNGDGDIDYIRVVDNMDKDVHAIVLQVPINEKENQDIAAIEIEKNGNESAVLQIIGDEELYPENTIIEPSDEAVDKSNSKSRKGPSVDGTMAVVVNVWLWPSVRFIYAPAYVVWVSPWRWLHYPGWWRPWRPHPWRWHHARVMPYHVHYKVAPVHRVVAAHKYYGPRRSSSVVVNNRYKSVHNTYIINNKHSRNRTINVDRNNSRMDNRNPRHDKMESPGQRGNNKMGKQNDGPRERSNKVRKARRG